MTDNMKIAAVICELNPLHFGHRRLLSLAGREGGVVCILSGNFVQRGEPAILDKWARAELALKSGADLVVELPLPWACAGAERFASGAVHLACALGCVDELWFGSETADIPLLTETARFLLSPDFAAALRKAGNGGGQPFAKIREDAVAAALGSRAGGLLQSPNAILAVEYLKALLREHSGIVPVAVKREGADHDETLGADSKQDVFRSAGEIRAWIRGGSGWEPHLPEASAAVLRRECKAGRCPADFSRLETAVLCKLRAMQPDEFRRLPDLSEGLENRLALAVRESTSLSGLYEAVKSKRYSHARVRRLVLGAFLGLSADLPGLSPYLRILGMNRKGEQILRSCSPSLPLAVRPADFERLGGEALRLFRLEARADDLYALSVPIPYACGADYTRKFLKL